MLQLLEYQKKFLMLLVLDVRIFQLMKVNYYTILTIALVVIELTLVHLIEQQEAQVDLTLLVLEVVMEEVPVDLVVTLAAVVVAVVAVVTKKEWFYHSFSFIRRSLI